MNIIFEQFWFLTFCYGVLANLFYLVLFVDWTSIKETEKKICLFRFLGLGVFSYLLIFFVLAVLMQEALLNMESLETNFIANLIYGVVFFILSLIHFGWVSIKKVKARPYFNDVVVGISFFFNKRYLLVSFIVSMISIRILQSVQAFYLLFLGYTTAIFLIALFLVLNFRNKEG